MAGRTAKKGKRKSIRKRTKRTQINRRTKRTQIKRRTKRLKRNKRKTQKKKRMKGGADYSPDEVGDIDQRFERAIATDGGDINWAALDLGTREKDLGLTIRETTQNQWIKYKKRDWNKWAKDNSVDQNPDTAFIAWGLYLTRKKNFPAMTTMPKFISNISDKYGAARLKKQREDRGQAKRPSAAAAAQSEPEYEPARIIAEGTCQKLGEGGPFGWGGSFSNYTYTFDGTSLLFTREDGELSEKNIDNIRYWEWIKMGNGLTFRHKEAHYTDRVLKFGSEEELYHLLGVLNLGLSLREGGGAAGGGAAAPAPARKLTKQEKGAKEAAKRERKSAGRASKTVALGGTAAPPAGSNRAFFNNYCGENFGSVTYGGHTAGPNNDGEGPISRRAPNGANKRNANRRKKADNACGEDKRVIQGDLVREDGTPVGGGAQQYVDCLDAIKNVQDAYGNTTAFDAVGNPTDADRDGRLHPSQWGEYRQWFGHCKNWRDIGDYLFKLDGGVPDAEDLKRATGWSSQPTGDPGPGYY